MDIVVSCLHVLPCNYPNITGNNSKVVCITHSNNYLIMYISKVIPIQRHNRQFVYYYMAIRANKDPQYS